METLSIEMLPQICPHHPDTRVVETKTSTSGLEKEEDVTLTQYKCAAGARCGQPLGWQFRHKTKEVYRYGPGQCDDPRMKQALTTTRYHTTTFVPCLVAGIIVALLIIILIMGVSTNAIPTSVTTGAATTTAALIITAATLFAIWRYRRRPPMPDFKIDAAEWNATQATEVRVGTST